MTAKPLTLVVNPGSASRKYGLFRNGERIACIYFEFVDGRVVGSVGYKNKQHSKEYDDSDLGFVSRYVLPLLKEYKIISKDEQIKKIGIRVVVPGDRFTQDELVTSDVEYAMEEARQKAPLHITTELIEIKQLKIHFPNVPIVAVSDSAFHITKPKWACYYGVDTELADKIGVKRYGYHGISVESVARDLNEREMLQPKTIVCHLGSGSSVTAINNGKSVDTTMGYTPLEGLVMASRSGNIDVSAAMAIKKELQLDDDGLERYLNSQSGLLGVSGTSNDIRQLLESEKNGDEKASLALKLFVYRIQQAIGQMSAVLGGVDCLVFTATVGERSSIIRNRILEKLGYLGFSIDSNVNDNTFEPVKITNIATESSKPVFVVTTNESIEIARRIEQFIPN